MGVEWGARIKWWGQKGGWKVGNGIEWGARMTWWDRKGVGR